MALVEKIATGLLCVAATAVAVAVVHREFGSRTVAVRIAPERMEELGNGGHSLGLPGAPLKVTVFTDIECPFCARFHRTLMASSAQRSADFEISYRHYPLTGHKNARKGAVALECAASQGRFEPLLSKFFEGQQEVAKWSLDHADGWVRYAAEAGVPDTIAFRECMVGESHADRIEHDMALASMLGLAATPMILVGDRKFTGALDEAAFDANLSRELRVRTWPYFLKRLADLAGSW